METDLGDRFEKALILAVQLHKKQKRKGTQIPYISHLLAVASIVLEERGSEDVVIAALLHDSVEDQGGMRTLEKIINLFGDHVASIVKSCSDSFSIIKPAWRDRKENYLRQLSSVSDEVIMVSLADKVHNARSIKHDLLFVGEKTWKRFAGGREGTLWYYSSLLDIYKQKSQSILVNELSELVSFISKF
jgi:(p)ppGpp synthase/HD superfamily hydrolase